MEKNDGTEEEITVQSVQELVKLIRDMPEDTVYEIDLGEEDDDED